MVVSSWLPMLIEHWFTEGVPMPSERTAVRSDGL